MSTTVTAWAAVAGLAGELVGAWGCWAPTAAPDGSRVAFVSDRTGDPRLWVQDTVAGGDPVLLPLSADPVLAVHWSPDGEWLACALATGGGVRTEVWVVRPDGSDARRLAGGEQQAALGHWAREGHRVLVTISDDRPGEPNEAVLIDAETGKSEPVAEGGLVTVLDLSADTRFALLRDGSRGAQFCLMLDRAADRDKPILPYPETGSTDVGLLRPAPSGDPRFRHTAYLVTDAGLPRRELVAIGLDENGNRIAAGTLAAREDAELEFADADAAGSTLLLVWNVGGRSEVELLDTVSGARTPCPGLPGEVVAGAVLSRDGSCAVLSVEGPSAPRRIWSLSVSSRQWAPVTEPAIGERDDLVAPELVEFEARDGLPLTGWLYPGQGGSGAAMISLHGGPEAQERPVFNPQHQVLAAAGITVFAPNIRGSSGFGRAFVHADDRYGRFDAIRDVADSALVLVREHGADPHRIAVSGRSYGGYATLLALAWHAELFTAGVDICGMSDLLTFYRDTEPWIAAAAVTKYGDPQHDAGLLAELSPLHQAELIDAPLLVVHGELDTNVPRHEALQIVARLRALGRPVEYLELAGEGHEYRSVTARLALLEALTRFLTAALDSAQNRR
jgi:dipeptidyl aminopeptidase/acylaminoacyl peptidase